MFNSTFVPGCFSSRRESSWCIYTSASIHIEYDITHDWWTCLPDEFRSFLRFTNINFHQAFAPWCCIWLAMHSDKRELLHCVMLVAYVAPWYALSSTTHHSAHVSCNKYLRWVWWRLFCEIIEWKMRSWSSRVRDGDWWLKGSTWKLRCYKWKVMRFVFSKWNW